MSKLSLALDTCLLASLDDQKVVGHPEGYDAVDLVYHLIRLIKNDKVAILIDSADEILSQYRRHLRNRQLAQTIITCALKYGKIDYRSERLPNKSLVKLKKIAFDPADLCFLHVAYKVSGIYATSEEKHLEDSRRRLVMDICSVQTVSIDELVQICKDL